MRPASRTTLPRRISYLRFSLALSTMIFLYVLNFFVLSTRQLIHWLCLWLDRWFDLVGAWGGMDTRGSGIPYASDTDLIDMPPGFGWLPFPSTELPYSDRTDT